ncbi:MAG: hypothetical protein M0Z82_12610 [Actinomycetota bacterium]|nr:hypothetical protein [Actinomycetota bacterium]
MDEDGQVLRHRVIAVLAVGVLLAWCGWASAYRAGTNGGKVIWAVSLAVVAVVAVVADGAWRRGHRQWVAPRPAPAWPAPAGADDRRSVLRGMAPWLVLALVVVTWEALGIDTGRHQPHLTLSALVLAFRAMRAATLAVWTGLGLGFVAVRLRARAVPDLHRRRRRCRWPSSASHGALVPGALILGTALVSRRSMPTARRVRSALTAWTRWPVPTARTARSEASVRVARSAQARGIPTATAGLGLLHHSSLLALLEGDSRAVGVGFWIGVVVVAGAVEVMARRSAGRFCTFEQLLRWISEPVLAEVVAAAAWVYAGWHLFAH